MLVGALVVMGSIPNTFAEAAKIPCCRAAGSIEANVAFSRHRLSSRRLDALKKIIMY